MKWAINKTEHWETDQHLSALYDKLVKVESESEALTDINRIIELLDEAAESLEFSQLPEEL